MIPRCFILLGIFALFCAIAVITAEKDKQEGEEGGKGEEGGQGEEGGKGEVGEEGEKGEKGEEREAVTKGGDDDEARAGWPAVIAKAFGALFIGAAQGCFTEAFRKCNGHKSFGGAIRCGRDFLKANKGHCTVG